MRIWIQNPGENTATYVEHAISTEALHLPEQPNQLLCQELNQTTQHTWDYLWGYCIHLGGGGGEEGGGRERGEEGERRRERGKGRGRGGREEGGWGGGGAEGKEGEWTGQKCA